MVELAHAARAAHAVPAARPKAAGARKLSADQLAALEWFLLDFTRRPEALRPEGGWARCGRCSHRWPARTMERHKVWKAQAGRFAVDALVCRPCYDVLRRPDVRAQRKQARAHRREVVGDVLRGDRWTLFAPAQPQPIVLARGRELHAESGVGCATPAEFAVWYAAALEVESDGGAPATLQTFCDDSADPAWCAAHRAAGTCALATLGLTRGKATAVATPPLLALLAQEPVVS